VRTGMRCETRQFFYLDKGYLVFEIHALPVSVVNQLLSLRFSHIMASWEQFWQITSSSFWVVGDWEFTNIGSHESRGCQGDIWRWRHLPALFQGYVLRWRHFRALFVGWCNPIFRTYNVILFLEFLGAVGVMCAVVARGFAGHYHRCAILILYILYLFFIIFYLYHRNPYLFNFVIIYYFNVHLLLILVFFI